MIVHRCQQGSEEWFDLHRGRPSVGGYSRIMTPKKMTLSDQRSKYRNVLLEQWACGAFPMDAQSAYMARGTELESRARAWYEFEAETTVEQVGFIERDDGLTGGSPDGLVGDVGIVEIKCLGAANHLGYLCGDDDKGIYYLQCQGLMSITGRAWVDRVTWHPTLPSDIRRVHRDDEYIKSLDNCVRLFLDELEAAKCHLVERGVKPWTPPEKCPHGLNPAVCRACREE